MASLRELDAALHHFFLNEARRGTDQTRGEFIDGILRIVESPESRNVERITELQQLISRWRHLDALMDAFRRDVDIVAEAERFSQTREHASELVAILSDAGAEGVTAGALAKQLEISPPHLAKLLRELDSRDIIERHSVGRNVYVVLGLVGQLMLEKRNKVEQVEERGAGSQEIPPPEDARVDRYLSDPRSVFDIAAVSSFVN